ncbi:MAG: helix-turn-helix transcriptional regulator [Lachnospiraceae bacterium]|nr:helix-turn-helix transcriptional regulator [Lachnospiraceae bacterium]
MHNKNVSLNKNHAEEQSWESRRLDRDMERIPQQAFIEKVIRDLEEQRRKRWKDYRKYTQKYVAEKAGISPSTYKGYVSGRSYHIDLITAKNIADALGCRLSDVIERAEH